MSNLKLHLVVAAAISAFSLQSLAACYTFVNGKGPSAVGAVPLPGVAEKLCIVTTRTMAGSQNLSAQFSDSRGILAVFGISNSVEARSLDLTDAQFDLSYGNAGGVNVDGSGTRIQIKGDKRQNIQVELGTVTVMDRSGRTAAFLYMKK